MGNSGPARIARTPAAATLGVCVQSHPPVQDQHFRPFTPPTDESIALRTNSAMTTRKDQRRMDTGGVDSGIGRFRILALAGGGIRGAFTASVLAELEKQTGTRCAERFDLITGTSTGGLLAIALAMGHPAQELCDLYRRNGKKIFPLER